MNTHDKINENLVSLFDDILDIEEKYLCRGEFSNLSINEIHIIDKIGLNSEQTMSDTAKKLKVTSGTLTTSINNLIRKGYVERRRSQSDRRVVKIKLTDIGEKAYNFHESFHVDLVFTVTEDLNENEQNILVDMLNKIKISFKKRYE